jgi:excisionase family DNA binding protein
MHGSDATTTGTGGRYAYTVGQAAQLLSLSYSKVEKLVASGELPSFKIGKSRRISGAAIEDFVRRQENAA